MTRPVTCGVIVTDGRAVILGHASRSTRWDIPKGLADAGEAFEPAARRELFEETGLVAPPDGLSDLGVHRYLPAKDLSLYLWLVPVLPDPASLRCTSMVGEGRSAFPEFDRFAAPDWTAAFGMLGKSMAAVLRPLAASHRWG